MIVSVVVTTASMHTKLKVYRVAIPHCQPCVTVTKVGVGLGSSTCPFSLLKDETVDIELNVLLGIGDKSVNNRQLTA